MTAAAALLDAAARARFAQLADAILPGDGHLPSASGAGATAEWLDAALAYRADLVPVLRRVLAVPDAHPRDPATSLRDLEARDVAGFQALVFLAVGAYFLSPRVCELLGYPGVQVPISVTGPADHVDLLGPVVRRGAIYRPTPDLSTGVV